MQTSPVVLPPTPPWPPPPPCRPCSCYRTVLQLLLLLPLPFHSRFTNTLFPPFPLQAMFMLSQLVYGHQAARLFAFVYLASIHLLVFASLARMTHHSSSALYAHTQVGPKPPVLPALLPYSFLT